MIQGVLLMTCSGRLMSGNIGVIGTAGRKEDGQILNGYFYQLMYDAALKAQSDWQVQNVVSGGAAYADHLAVKAYLEDAFSDLFLFLPAPFSNGKFESTPHIRFNPGLTLNRYHYKFSKACDIDSLREIQLAIEKGAHVKVREGFHSRNLEVAHSVDALLAFTFGHHKADMEKDFEPDDAGFSSSREAGVKDGGTAHTWSNTGSRVAIKRHVNLTKVMLNNDNFPNAKMR